MTNNEKEARRRVSEACRIIASTIRLGHPDAGEIVKEVRVAISTGADQLAEDIRDEAGR